MTGVSKRGGSRHGATHRTRRASGGMLREYPGNVVVLPAARTNPSNGRTPAFSNVHNGHASIRDIASLSARATEVFGSSDKAMRWLETPVPSLDFRTPLSLLSSPEGMAEIEDTLGAIEHGIW
jgi:hypothetical protein